MKRLTLAALTLATASLLAACAKQESPAPPAPSAPSVGAPSPGASALHIAQGEDLSKKALEILNQRCTACHGAERFSAKDFTPEQWNAVIDRMVTKGAKLSGDELDVLRHMRK